MALTSSRNRRLDRLRVTALPNRLPTTIPTWLTECSARLASKLKYCVELRRPWRFTCSISRLTRKNMGPVLARELISRCPPGCAYNFVGGSNRQESDRQPHHAERKKKHRPSLCFALKHLSRQAIGKPTNPAPSTVSEIQNVRRPDERGLLRGGEPGPSVRSLCSFAYENHAHAFFSDWKAAET